MEITESEKEKNKRSQLSFVNIQSKKRKMAAFLAAIKKKKQCAGQKAKKSDESPTQ
jgi:hypothetical protein